MYADLKLLEFAKVLQRVVDAAETDYGKQLASAITPSDDVYIIQAMLQETEEARTMIAAFDTVPMGGILNVTEALKRANLGASLNIEEFSRVANLCAGIDAAQRYIRKIRTLELKSTALDPYFKDMVPLPQVKKAIDAVIDEKGGIYDSASPKLSDIRRKITQATKKISEKMESLLRSEGSKLTDTIITIRDNRLVLPVKAEYKNSFKGIVHDYSSSKETVFIEPSGCVEMNNAIQTLLIDELAEIERILAELTIVVATHHDELAEDFKLVTQLDVIFAKAKYAIQTEARIPEITEDEISLVAARHPLIDPAKVVANTIAFHKYRTIIITGPNTGGKTVALKTLGLLAVMAQSGLLLPVGEHTKTKVFSGIYADIGDEQSIEQSLSTFSSHITKISEITKHVDADSLVLIDEIGTGTDPKEGASLAISIIEFFRKRRVHLMVSTHYPELKAYAYNLDDVVNASVEFDIETLKPTYRLQIGTPGTSNAIEIATRLGLHQDIVGHAREVSLAFDNQTSNLIKKLERQSIELNAEQTAVENDRHILQQKADEYEKLIIRQKHEQNRVLMDIETQKQNVIQSAKQAAQKLIDELDEMKKNASFKEHELAKLKFDVRQLDETKVDYKKVNQTAIQVGDTVRVIPYNRNGIVSKALGGGSYQIEMGNLTSIFSQNLLEYLGRSDQKAAPGKVSVTRLSEAHAELDLRGLRFEEAMTLLDKYVDDCLIHNLEFAYIIHGYGTGALRKGVLEYLKGHPQIKSSRPGGQGEGGSGVTVITFR